MRSTSEINEKIDEIEKRWDEEGQIDEYDLGVIEALQWVQGLNIPTLEEKIINAINKAEKEKE